jgi:hypothetical protein
MPTIRTTYRIYDKLNHCRPDDTSEWRLKYTMPEGMSYEDVEAFYEKLRHDYPHAPLRLVSVTEHEVRSGKGRVYL